MVSESDNSIVEGSPSKTAAFVSSDEKDKSRVEINSSHSLVHTVGTNAEVYLKDILPKHDKFWIHYPHLLKLNILLLGAILAQVTNGYDSSLLNGMQALPVWLSYFNTPTGANLGTINNGVVIGTLIMSPFISILSDLIGRKYTMIVGSGIAIIGAVLQGCANNTGCFIGGRILIGCGTGLSCAVSEIYLTETSYPSHRPSIVGFSQAGYPIGSFIGSLITWGPYNSSLKDGNWSWRLPSLLQTVFPVLQFLLIFLAPESPRYQVAHGKPEKAREFFVKYHAGGDESSPLVNFQMDQIQATIEAEKQMQMSKWSEWFKSKAMIHRLCIVLGLAPMIQLCGNAIISYYLSIMLNGIGITNPMTKLKINIGISAYGMIWDVATAYFISVVRRRVLFMTGFLSCCVCYIVYTVLSCIIAERDFKDVSLGYGAVVMIFAFQGFYHIIGPLGIVYYSEITPFSLRAKAAQMYITMGNATGLFNGYVNPIAMVAIGWKYYIVWTCWLPCMAVIVYFYFPETYGKSLEEINEVFGDSNVDMENVTTKYKGNVVHKDEKDLESSIHKAL